MGKRKRPDFSHQIVHVVNRGVQRRQLFWDVDDYSAFVGLMEESLQEQRLRLLAFCLMPNHWHLVVWPISGEQLPRFMHRLTLTHAMRWHAFHGSGGSGHVYQGRYRASPVQPEDEHVLRVLRYVERNALRANLVASAVDWRWGSLRLRTLGDPRCLLDDPPVALGSDWASHVDRPLNEPELAALRRAANRGAPIGDEAWVEATVRELGLEHTLRGPGRPPGV